MILPAKVCKNFAIVKTKKNRAAHSFSNINLKYLTGSIIQKKYKYEFIFKNKLKMLNWFNNLKSTNMMTFKFAEI